MPSVVSMRVVVRASCLRNIMYPLISVAAHRQAGCPHHNTQYRLDIAGGAPYVRILEL